MAVRYIPVQTAYSPDARILTVFSNAKTMYCLRYGNQGEDLKEQWYQTDIPGVRNILVFNAAPSKHIISSSRLHQLFSVLPATP